MGLYIYSIFVVMLKKAVKIHVIIQSHRTALLKPEDLLRF